MKRGVVANRLRVFGRYVVALSMGVGCAGVAQAPPVVKAFHPSGRMSSFEVATIKPADPAKQYGGTTLRRYIAMAYGVPLPWGMPGVELQGSQVIGGPEWIDKDRYDIKGKPPDELRAAMEKMPSEERRAQDEMMQQGLLAERFHLKVHFETREMPVFELVPAKGGLKITPMEQAPGAGVSKSNMTLHVGNNGLNILEAHAMTLEMLGNAIRGQAAEVRGRPVINMTGFTGSFDLKDFRFIGLAYTQGPAGASATEPDAPSLSQALEEKLGIKLLAAKGQVGGGGDRLDRSANRELRRPFAVSMQHGGCFIVLQGRADGGAVSCI